MQYATPEEVIISDDMGLTVQGWGGPGCSQCWGGLKERRKDRAWVFCKRSPGGRFTAGENLCTAEK